MVNYLAVLVAGIVSIILGFLWYGPLFGKTWMRLMKISPKDIEEGKKKGMAKNYILMTISTLLTAYILAVFLNLTNTASLSRGMLTAFLIWLGFIATITLGSVLWEGKSFKLYLLNNLYNVISLLLTSAILVLWK